MTLGSLRADRLDDWGERFLCVCDPTPASIAWQTFSGDKLMMTSRLFTLTLLFWCALVYCSENCSIAVGEELDVWIGTRKPADQPAGIYHLTFNDKTGKLSRSKLMAKREGAGFLAMHPTLDVLYATGNSLSAWQIVRNKDGVQLKRINEQPTGAGGATHISVDPTGQVLMSAHYGSGHICVFPLRENGAIGKRATKIWHNEPSQVDAKRQKTCHPHWIGSSADSRFVLVPDLGADKIFVYQLDAATGKLTRHGDCVAPPGSGPRHFKFHPTLPVGYLLNEFTMSLSVMDYDADQGTLTVTQNAPALSEEQMASEMFNSASEVRVHPSGKFLYSGNRGHDTISAFAIDQTSGELSLIEQEPIRGCWPRNFNLDPSGKWLLAAGGHSHTLAVFKIDPQSGKLQYARSIASVPTPICVLVEPKNKRE